MGSQDFASIVQQREVIVQIEYKLHRQTNGDQQLQSEKGFLPFRSLQQCLRFKLFRPFFKRYATSWFLLSFSHKHNEKSEELISIIQQGRLRDLSKLVDTWTSRLMPCFEMFVQSQSFSDYKGKVDYWYYECLAQTSAPDKSDDDCNYPACKCEECWQKHREARKLKPRKSKSEKSKSQKRIATSYKPQKHIAPHNKPQKHIATSYNISRSSQLIFQECSDRILREFVPESVASVIIEFVELIDNRIEQLLAKLDINPKYLDNFIRQDISFDSILFLTEYKVYFLVPTIGSRYKLRAYIRQQQQRLCQTNNIYPKGPMRLISRAVDRRQFGKEH